MARLPSDPFDFDPRPLVPSRVPGRHSNRVSGQSRLDAIFIPTRARPRLLKVLLDELGTPRTPIFILPTDPNEDLLDVGPLWKTASVLAGGDYSHPRASGFGHLPYNITPTGWDLPQKRNFALDFARASGFERILLLDDDIRGVSQSLLDEAADLLADYTVVGPVVDDFPDLSVVGHARRTSGAVVHAFLSGSCLFLNTHTTDGCFPSIYNEDWLFLLPQIINQTVLMLGRVRQVPYDPFLPSRASSQEFGEVIADGLYWMHSVGRFTERLTPATWTELLIARRAQLVTLISAVHEPAPIASLQAALDVSNRIIADHCVQFVLEWDRSSIGQIARGLK